MVSRTDDTITRWESPNDIDFPHDVNVFHQASIDILEAALEYLHGLATYGDGTATCRMMLLVHPVSRVISDLHFAWDDETEIPEDLGPATAIRDECRALLLEIADAVLLEAFTTGTLSDRTMTTLERLALICQPELRKTLSLLRSAAPELTL
jgi:hypothetical protein